MARATANTSRPMFAGDPAHFISPTNKAQFRPASVVGLTGKRQPFGIGSASSSSE